MNKNERIPSHIEGISGCLPIQNDDVLAWQLAMIFEGECFGLGPGKAAKKYGYSKQRYFQLTRAFKQGGTRALTPQKTGPKKNHVRTENIVSEVLRHRFLDPEASADVLAQKIRQAGMRISVRSVQRVIAERGLQKKTLLVPTS